MATTNSIDDYVWREWATDSTSTSNIYSTGDSNWGVWSTWVGSDGTTSYSSDKIVWSKWTATGTDDSGTEVYSSQGTVWAKWSDTYKERKYKSIVSRPALITTPTKSTEQIRAERVQRELETIWYQYQAELLRQEKQEAEDRALELLADIIGEDQMLLYKETGRLVVHGEKHDWLLRKGKTILKLNSKEARDFCVHLKDRHSYPETDNIISLALRLKQDEKEVEKIANRNNTLSHEYVGEGVKAKRVDYKEAVKLIEDKKDLAVNLMAASY